MIEFGEQLRRAREAKGMTQQSLAEKLYVTRQAVSRWECGDRFPDLITTKKISLILEVSLDDLLSENEMKKAVEKSPVIETSFANHAMIALFVLAIFSFIVTAADIIIRFPFNSVQMDNSDIQIIVINLIGLTAQIIVFSYGLLMAWKEMLSPKRTGIVAAVFFATVCLADSNRFFGSTAGQLAFIVLLLIVPSVIGAAASYMFFCKASAEKAWMELIVVCSLWGIIRMVSNHYIIYYYTGRFVSMNAALRLLLEVCIYGLIIYQVYMLRRKRKNAIEMIQQ